MKYKIPLAKIVFVILFLNLVATFIVWLSYPVDQKGTINRTGVYYDSTVPYGDYFLLNCLLMAVSAFFCFVGLIGSLCRTACLSVKKYSWLCWLLNTALCIFSLFLSQEYFFDIHGGAL